MFTEQEWAALIAKLRQLTELGKVSWEPAGLVDLTLTLGNAKYQLSARDDDNQPPWRLTVYKVQDEFPYMERVVDSIDSDYSDESSEVPASLVPGLRDLAFRMSLGGPQLATDLLNDMLKLDPTEPPRFDGAPF